MLILRRSLFVWIWLPNLILLNSLTGCDTYLRYFTSMISSKTTCLVLGCLSHLGFMLQHYRNLMGNLLKSLCHMWTIFEKVGLGHLLKTLCFLYLYLFLLYNRLILIDNLPLCWRWRRDHCIIRLLILFLSAIMSVINFLAI